MNRQASQADEYEFPYHYLTQLRGKGFRSYRSFSWSLSYAAALQIVTEELKQIGTSAHLDIGCGDGALCRHLSEVMPQTKVVGLDYDERAIGFARSFNPGIEFVAGDICSIDCPIPFQTASLVEVLEHIPVAQIPPFIEGIARTMAPGGQLLVTVPSVNKVLESKHEQHFTEGSLIEALAPHFSVHGQIFGFERKSRFARFLTKAMTRPGFFMEIAAVNRWLLQRELKFRRYSGTDYGRIFLVAHRI